MPEIDATDLHQTISAMLPRLDLVELSQVYALVRSRAAYRDDGYPARACDNCGTSYKGPAVYCRHACAVADDGAVLAFTATVAPEDAAWMSARLREQGCEILDLKDEITRLTQGG